MDIEQQGGVLSLSNDGVEVLKGIPGFSKTARWHDSGEGLKILFSPNISFLFKLIEKNHLGSFTVVEKIEGGVVSTHQIFVYELDSFQLYPIQISKEDFLGSWQFIDSDTNYKITIEGEFSINYPDLDFEGAPQIWTIYENRFLVYQYLINEEFSRDLNEVKKCHLLMAEDCKLYRFRNYELIVKISDSLLVMRNFYLGDSVLGGSKQRNILIHHLNPIE